MSRLWWICATVCAVVATYCAGVGALKVANDIWPAPSQQLQEQVGP